MVLRVPGTGPQKFTVHKAGRYKVSVAPDFHQDRLKWVTQGGKQYPSTDWLPDGCITLTGPGIDTRVQGRPSPFNPARNFVDVGSWAELRLQPGEYTLTPSPGFVGSFSFDVRQVFR